MPRTHRRQNAPVEQQRGEHAHDKHDGERLKRQDEVRARRLEIKRQRAAAEIPEYERRARARGGRNRTDGVVDDAEPMGDERQFYQCHGGEKGDGEADGCLPQRDRAAIFTECPCDRE